MTKHGKLICLAASLRSVRHLSKQLKLLLRVEFSGCGQTRTIATDLHRLMACDAKTFLQEVKAAKAAGHFSATPPSK